MLRQEKGYVTAMFGKCMNNDCGANAQARGLNLHQMGAFDRWFEGITYENGIFYDNEAEGCVWPWLENDPNCKTYTNGSTVGAG